MQASSDVMGRQSLEWRQRVVDDAIAQGLPSTRHEDWRYTSLRSLADYSFDLFPKRDEGVTKNAAILQRIKQRLIPGSIPVVFLDGQLLPLFWREYPQSTEFVSPLNEVEQSEDATWWDRWLPAMDSGKIFWKVCIGLSTEGVVVNVPRRALDVKTIHVLHIKSGQSPKSFANNRTLINVGDGSDVNIIEEFLGALDQGPGDVGCWDNTMTQVRVGIKAGCSYYRIVDAKGMFHTGAVTARLDQGSRFECASLALGAKLARVDIDVVHTATESECSLYGLSLLSGQDHFDHHTKTDHAVGQTLTNQLFKGVLADASRLVFNGKIFIRKNSQKAEAYQTCKNLLLSKTAEVNAKPQLEIEADDVKASHGAAIGSIDPEELFYLQSRCIDKAQASAMLCRGFADDVILKIGNPVFRKFLGERVDEWFSRLSQQSSSVDGPR